MNTYIVRWPDNSISILNAECDLQLFEMLDCEGDPSSAEIHKINTDAFFYITLTSSKPEEKIHFDTCEDMYGNSIKKHKFPKNIALEWYRLIKEQAESVK